MDKHKERLSKYIAPVLENSIQDEYISFIHERVGILVKRDHKEMLKVISKACEINHISPEEYLQRLRTSEDDSDLLNDLISAITIGETYFFRDKQQVKLLNDVVLPKIIKKKIESGERVIRVWSAGCSSGEEIYTIVMLLQELLPDIDNWQCYLLASDINIDVLKKGMSGEYTEWSMRSIPETYLKRYFEKNGTIYKIDNDIRKRVRFEYINLNTDTYPSIMNGTVMQDLVICRNVLIYFDDKHIQKILERLSRCIVDDGYIMLGASDPIAMMEVGIGSVNNYPSLFMKKSKIPKPENMEAISHESVKYKRDVSPVVTIPKKIIQTDKIDDVLNKTLQDTNKANAEIDNLLKQEKWQEIVSYIGRYSLMYPINSKMLAIKAAALANLGKIDDAIQTCKESIKMDKMNKEVYLIYGLALSENKQNKEAEQAFRAALYIDPDYLLCRYQLGLFLIHHNRLDEGVMTLQKAINSASKCNGDDVVPESKNMKYKDLIVILKREMQLYQ
ncbi:MAG TPA: CheR family methyltransferase [Gammaproteobacteria bacterium]|nr:CheR family methyltransferase [Gammaproteobacteria bacterium]